MRKYWQMAQELIRHDIHASSNCSQATFLEIWYRWRPTAFGHPSDAPASKITVTSSSRVLRVLATSLKISEGFQNVT